MSDSESSFIDTVGSRCIQFVFDKYVMYIGLYDFSERSKAFSNLHMLLTDKGSENPVDEALAEGGKAESVLWHMYARVKKRLAGL